MEKEERKKKKYYIITKNKEECVILELKEFFEDPNKYLQEGTKFMIGNYHLNNYKNSKSLVNFKKNNEFDINNNTNNNINELYEKIDSKVPTTNCLNNNKLYNNSKNKKRCISAFNLKRMINNNNMNDVKKNSRNLLHTPYSVKNNNSFSPKKRNIHYEFKTPKEIIDIFAKYNKNEKKNENLQLFSNKINDFINQKYLIQEKNLKLNNEEKQNYDNFSKYLSQKCGKKEENLLLNKIDNYNIKKQIINYIYNSKNLAERLGNNFWICNLKRSKHNYKINYVNTGKNGKEPWEQIIDAGDMEVELINNPSIPLNIDKNREINYFKNKKYPNLNSFNKIKVIGRKLFDQEYNNFINNINNNNKTVKYKLYKDPQEKKTKSIQELTYKENYRPLSRKKINLKRKII